MSNKYKIFTALAILLISLAGFYFFVGNKNESEFLKNEKTVVAEIVALSILCQPVTEYYSIVWRNSIYKEGTFYNGQYKFMEFSKALPIIQKELENSINAIIRRENTVDSLMKAISNPPRKYMDAYNETVRLYGLSTEFSTLTKNPSGSFNSFSDKTIVLPTSIMKLAKEIIIRLPTEEINKK